MKKLTLILFLLCSVHLLLAQNPPINDDCANAVNIPIINNLGNATSGLTVLNATESIDPSICSGDTGSIARDVWFKFTAISTEHIITVIPSYDFDPVLDVRSGGCLGSTLKCVDNGGGHGFTETSVVTTTIGTDYLIRIYHYTESNYYPPTFGFSLKVENQPPSNTCTTPTGISETNITSSSAVLEIPPVSGALKYKFTWREVGSNIWWDELQNSNQRTIAGLNPNTDYEWKGKVKCANGNWTSYSNKNIFTTSNGTQNSYTVSGYITDGSSGVSGINVNFDGNSTQTDNTGNYYFNNVPSGTSGNVVPSSNLYTFSSNSIPVNTLSSNIILNSLVATLIPSCTGNEIDQICFKSNSTTQLGNYTDLVGNVRAGLSTSSSSPLYFGNNLMLYNSLKDISGTGIISVKNVLKGNTVQNIDLYQGSYDFDVNGSFINGKTSFDENNSILEIGKYDIFFEDLKLLDDGVQIVNSYLKFPFPLRSISNPFEKYAFTNIDITTNGINPSIVTPPFSDPLMLLGIPVISYLQYTYDKPNDELKAKTEIRSFIFDIGGEFSVYQGKINSFGGYIDIDIPSSLKTVKAGLPFQSASFLINNITNNNINRPLKVEIDIKKIRYGGGITLDVNGFTSLGSIHLGGRGLISGAYKTLDLGVEFEYKHKPFKIKVAGIANFLSIRHNNNNYNLLTGELKLAFSEKKFTGSGILGLKLPYLDKPRWLFDLIDDAICDLPCKVGPAEVHFSGTRSGNYAAMGFSLLRLNGYGYVSGNEYKFSSKYTKLPWFAQSHFNGGGLVPFIAQNAPMSIITSNQEIIFDVDIASPLLIVEGINSTTDFNITFPDGSILNRTNVNNTSLRFNEDLSDNYQYFLIENPQLGQYKITQFSGDSVEISLSKNIPVIDIIDIQNGSNQLNISWMGSDHDDNGTVAFYLDDDNADGNGIPIVKNLLETDGLNTFTWNYDTIPSGKYYIYAVIEDDIKQFDIAYFQEPIKIIEIGAPNAPSNLNYILTDTSIMLNWIDNNPADPIIHQIYYDEKIVTFNSDVTTIGDTNSVEIIDIPLGKSYYFTVVAMDTLNRQSDYSNVIQINNISSLLNNPPNIITNDFETVATVSQNYSQTIVATDADGDNLTYSLINPPTGCSINASGVISWSPSSASKGFHNIKILVTDSHGGIDSIDYNMFVITSIGGEASIEFSKPLYTNYNSIGKIIVRDCDAANTNMNLIDTIQIKLYSTSDAVGTILNAIETEPNSKKFTAIFEIHNTTTTLNKLFANSGDSLWVEYNDVSSQIVSSQLSRFIVLGADFETPNIICSGDTLILVNQSNGSGLTYTWNIDGLVSTDKSPTHVFTTNNDGNGQEIKNISLTITDIEGHVSTKNYTVTVFERPLLNIQDSLSTCDEIIINTQNSVNQVVWSNRDTMNVKIFHQSAFETIEVTNVHGCISRDSVQVNILNTMELDNNINPILCHGQTTDIDLQVNLGTAPFSYAWNNNLVSQDLTALSGGTYEVTVTDANTCERSDTFIIIEPAALISTVATTHNPCYGYTQGTIDVNVLGGVGAYNYAWTGVNSNNNQSSNLGAGTYSVDVTDANGCLLKETITIVEPTDISLTTNIVDVDCHGASSGQIITSLYGGNYPYNYSWTDGDTNFIRNNVPAGTYTMMVTDQNGCPDSLTIQVNEPNPIHIITTTTNNDCYEDELGNINISVTGGISPYTYYWNTAEPTQNLNNLSAGIYQATITDANLCTHYITDTITEPLEISNVITPINILCHGDLSGAITLNSIGGTGNLIYNWNDGGIGAQRTNLSAGTYIVTVSDDNGCSKTELITLTEPTSLSTNRAIRPPSCFGFSDGTLDISPQGGVGSYSFIWNTTDTTEDLSGLSNGQYTLTLTDDNGCSYTKTFTITEPDSLEISHQVTHPLCVGNTNGSINQTIAGGTIPYFYTWNNSVQTSNMSNLPAGNYSFTITDVNGCQDSSSYELATPNPLIISLLTQDELCTSQSGSATVTPTDGTAPYSYFWNNGSTTQSINNLSSNVYAVTVTDANGCMVNQSINLLSNDPMSINTMVNDILCHGQGNGNINITPVNGTFPFFFNWNDGSLAQNRTSLGAGNYSLTVTDVNGCVSIVDTSIVEPEALHIGFSNLINACAGNIGTLTANIGGGTPPLIYTWNGTNQTTPQINNLSAGSYTVTAVDANGCTISSVEPIEVYGDPVADFSYITNNLTVSFTDMSQSAQIISWNFGDGNGSYTSNSTHTYNGFGSYIVTMTVSNPCGMDTMTVVLDLFATNVHEMIDECDITIYPNPNQGLFNIELNCANPNSDYNIEIYNLIGQKIFNSLNYQNSIQKIDLTQMTNGIYFIHLTNQNGERLKMEKIIIQK